jgi:hypothetical protein
MQPVLDAVNVLQRVAFTINKPVLDFVKRDGKAAIAFGTAAACSGSKTSGRDGLRHWPTASHLTLTWSRPMRWRPWAFWVQLNIDFRGPYLWRPVF